MLSVDVMKESVALSLAQGSRCCFRQRVSCRENAKDIVGVVHRASSTTD
jgi:hypothetical protein